MTDARSSPDVRGPVGFSAAELEAKRREIVNRWGPWQQHNVFLGDGVYTMGDEAHEGQRSRLPQYVQVASDLLPMPLEQARVLDLAAHEGLFAIEFARRGSEVLAVEIRQDHVEKARFARDVLELSNMEIRLDDVRNITRERDGGFDLVLCLGILYHLDARSAFDLVNRLGRLCNALAIVDTVVSLQDRESFEHHGFTYWGRSIWEHDPAATTDERLRAHGASFDNRESFWLTRPSFYNLLRRSGFTSVLELRVPRPVYSALDRPVLAAIKGAPQQQMLSAPLAGSFGDPDWPQRERLRVRPAQTRLGRLKYLLARALPAAARRSYRRSRSAKRR
jgi:hypothetical protein